MRHSSIRFFLFLVLWAVTLGELQIRRHRHEAEEKLGAAFDQRIFQDVIGGTRLTLWTNIDRRYIAMGAAGRHICFDVLDHLLSGTSIGRIAGPDAMKFDGWQRLHAEYARQFGKE